MWPNASIGVMGPDQLSSVMQSVQGKRNPDQSDTRKAELKAKIEGQTTALYSTARIWVRNEERGVAVAVCYERA